MSRKFVSLTCEACKSTRQASVSVGQFDGWPGPAWMEHQNVSTPNLSAKEMVIKGIQAMEVRFQSEQWLIKEPIKLIFSKNTDHPDIATYDIHHGEELVAGLQVSYQDSVLVDCKYRVLDAIGSPMNEVLNRIFSKISITEFEARPQGFELTYDRLWDRLLILGFEPDPDQIIWN